MYGRRWGGVPTAPIRVQILARIAGAVRGPGSCCGYADATLLWWEWVPYGIEDVMSERADRRIVIHAILGAGGLGGFLGGALARAGPPVTLIVMIAARS